MKLTLRARVVLAACASILVAVALLAVGVSVLVEDQLRSNLDRSLRDRAAEVARLTVSAPALLTAPGALDTSIGGEQLSIEVLDRHGRRPGAVAGAGRLVPAGSPGRARDRRRAGQVRGRPARGSAPAPLRRPAAGRDGGGLGGCRRRGGHDRGDRRDARSAASVRGLVCARGRRARRRRLARARPPGDAPARAALGRGGGGGANGRPRAAAARAEHA